MSATGSPPGGQHLSFRGLADFLPLNGTREARRWLHVLGCDRCADAAIAILRGPAGRRLGPTDYDAVFARVEAELVSTYSLFKERRAHAAFFVAELVVLADEAGLLDALATAGEIEARLAGAPGAAERPPRVPK
jgi:hypothetical protein